MGERVKNEFLSQSHSIKGSNSSDMKEATSLTADLSTRKIINNIGKYTLSILERGQQFQGGEGSPSSW